MFYCVPLPWPWTMRFVLYNVLLLICFIASCTTLFPEYIITNNGGKQSKHSYSKPIDKNEIINNYLQTMDDDAKFKRIKMKAMVLRSSGNDKMRSSGVLYKTKGIEEDPEGFQQDPIMNMMANGRKNAVSESLSSSSSLEMQHWKEEWRDIWLKKKFEALNSSFPVGDTVNMAAARPWGVPCGDPNQHDMPWGTCMLPMECEAEFRIYRGDFSCGRTTFICCALQLTNYDMYGGLDVSFEQSSLETDTEEKKLRDLSSKEKRDRQKRREKRKRRRDRMRRKRKIKKNIKNIIKEIKRILDRAYRNGTAMRKRKTKQLKKFIKALKKQYRKDRASVKQIHEMEIIKIDAKLMKKLIQIRLVNRNFAKNSTFRDIIVNGTMNKKQARMLMEAYPELDGHILTRRAGHRPPPLDPLDYDVEYGYLYY